MTAARVGAPQTDGGLLVAPAPERLVNLPAENRSFLASWDYDVQGRSAIALRETARRDLAAVSRAYLGRFGLTTPAIDDAAIATTPLVATGHQPELFHPGVWIKNFAAWSLAQAWGGWSLNLVVDNDLAKSSAIFAPRSAAGRLKLERVEFDRLTSESPHEDERIADPALLASFPDRLRAVLGPLAPDAMVRDFWPRVMARGEVDRLGERFALARRQTEQEWGVSNFEAPLSSAAESTAFLWFAAHLLARLPRYVEVHNQALDEYRSVHGIRSKNHPVAALAALKDGWLEAPFWVWRRDQPRRRPLLARQNGRTLELRIGGEDETLLDLPLSEDAVACCAVERLRDLPAAGVRLRPRALTTTMFIRYFVADVFIHGIGGAKYDELGDVISRRFFGAAPPGFITLSLTLWLEGLPQDGADRALVALFERRARDLIYHPESGLGEQPALEMRNILAAKWEAIGGPVDTRRQRRARWAAIRRCDMALASLVQPESVRLAALRDDAAARAASNRVARNREFSMILHSESRLRDAVLAWTAPAGRSPGLSGSPGPTL